jgi:hypothetical protein
MPIASVSRTFSQSMDAALAQDSKETRPLGERVLAPAQRVQEGRTANNDSC